MQSLQRISSFIRPDSMKYFQIWYSEADQELKEKLTTISRKMVASVLHEEPSGSDDRAAAAPSRASESSSRPHAVPPLNLSRARTAATDTQAPPRTSIMGASTYRAAFRSWQDSLDDGMRARSMKPPPHKTLGEVPEYMLDTVRHWTNSVYRLGIGAPLPTDGQTARSVTAAVNPEAQGFIKAVGDALFRSEVLQTLTEWLSSAPLSDRMLFEDVFRSVYVAYRKYTAPTTSYTSTYVPVDLAALPYTARATTCKPLSLTARAVTTKPPVQSEGEVPGAAAAAPAAAASTTRSAALAPTTYQRSFVPGLSDGPPERKPRDYTSRSLRSLGYAMPSSAYQDTTRWAGACNMPPRDEVVKPSRASASIGCRVLGTS